MIHPDTIPIQHHWVPDFDLYVRMCTNCGARKRVTVGPDVSPFVRPSPGPYCKPEDIAFRNRCSPLRLRGRGGFAVMDDASFHNGETA